MFDKSPVETATKLLFLDGPVANALGSESSYIPTSGVLIQCCFAKLTTVL